MVSEEKKSSGFWTEFFNRIAYPFNCSSISLYAQTSSRQRNAVENSTMISNKSYVTFSTVLGKNMENIDSATYDTAYSLI